jgi:hypothetical protein
LVCDPSAGSAEGSSIVTESKNGEVSFVSSPAGDGSGTSSFVGGINVMGFKHPISTRILAAKPRRLTGFVFFIARSVPNNFPYKNLFLQVNKIYTWKNKKTIAG